MNSSKIVRTADLPISIVVRVLESLNRGKIILVTYGDDITIVTDTNPRQFNFPEGWYFSNGVFTNKFHASRHYSEAKIVNSRGSTWMGTAGCLPTKANN
jgi:predicted methyltransferase